MLLCAVVEERHVIFIHKRVCKSLSSDIFLGLAISSCIFHKLKLSRYNLDFVFHTVYFCIFHPCCLFLLFPLVHFPPLLSVPAFSTPAISTLALMPVSHFPLPFPVAPISRSSEVISITNCYIRVYFIFTLNYCKKWFVLGGKFINRQYRRTVYRGIFLMPVNRASLISASPVVCIMYQFELPDGVASDALC